MAKNTIVGSKTGLKEEEKGKVAEIFVKVKKEAVIEWHYERGGAKRDEVVAEARMAPKGGEAAHW